MSKKILIVDDEPDMIYIISQLLQSRGFVVESAENGEDALAWLGSHRPDLVISDIELPGINGAELCRKIKETPGTKNVVVLLLTGKDEDDIVRLSAESGADAHMAKPFDHNKFLSLVEKLTCASRSPQ